MDYAPKTHRGPRIDDRGGTTHNKSIMGMLIRYFPAAALGIAAAAD